MRRIFIITIFAITLFLIELMLFTIFDRWFKPNLLVVFVVFINMYLGIRWSLATAVICGVIKDSFTVGLFGLNIFSFVLCAYATTAIVKNHYQVGSIYSRMMTLFIITLLNVVVHYIINSMFGSVQLGQVIRYVLIPEVAVTMIVAGYCFNKLKNAAVKYAL